MIVLLIIIYLVIVILGFIGIYYMTKKIVVTDNNSNSLLGVLATFIGSLILGYFFGALKLVVATYVAMNRSKSGKCIKILFLDLLTLKVVNYLLRIRRSNNNSIEFINERNDKVQP